MTWLYLDLQPYVYLPIFFVCLSIFCLFGPLINKWFVSLNDKKICLELTTWLIYIYIYTYKYIEREFVFDSASFSQTSECIKKITENLEKRNKLIKLPISHLQAWILFMSMCQMISSVIMKMIKNWRQPKFGLKICTRGKRKNYSNSYSNDTSSFCFINGNELPTKAVSYNEPKLFVLSSYLIVINGSRNNIRAATWFASAKADHLRNEYLSIKHSISRYWSYFSKFKRQVYILR